MSRCHNAAANWCVAALQDRLQIGIRATSISAHPPKNPKLQAEISPQANISPASSRTFRERCPDGYSRLYSRWSRRVLGPDQPNAAMVLFRESLVNLVHHLQTCQSRQHATGRATHHCSDTNYDARGHFKFILTPGVARLNPWTTAAIRNLDRSCSPPLRSGWFNLIKSNSSRRIRRPASLPSRMLFGFGRNPQLNRSSSAGFWNETPHLYASG